jgi:hypothetical protein
MSTLRANAITTVAGKPLLNTTGSIIQVAYGDMGSNTATITSQDNQVIPFCSLSITPTSINSKILLIAHVVSNIRYVTTYGFARNGVNIGGNTNTNSSNSIATNWFGQTTGDPDQYFCTSFAYQYLDSPGTTSPITYAPTACSSWSGTPLQMRINDRNLLDMRSLTSITAMEIVQ